MLWIETGADNSEWNSKPMQIGVAGDPGLTSFLSGEEGGDLILPPALKGRLTSGTVRAIPAHNIRAGIGYLLMRMANFEHRSVLGSDPKVYEDPERQGGSMRTTKLIGFGLAACLPALALATSTDLDERALREECCAFSQAGMRDCLAKKAENSQKALRQAEEKADSTFSKWDEDKKYANQAKAKLAASNKEFAKYRETQCEFSASLSGGAIGNALEMRRLACVAELNNRRAEQLRNAVSDLPLK